MRGKVNKWMAIYLIISVIIVGVMVTLPVIVSLNKPDPSVECVKIGGEWVDTNPSFVVNMGCKK